MVSDTLRRRLVAALGGQDIPIQVVPNLVDVDAFWSTGHDARDPDELLWVGGRSAGKGTDVLLRAFTLLRESRPALRLRLIGRAPDPGEEARLVALARDLGIADAVSFEPAVDRSGVAAAMAHAAVFVHPSPYETFGIVAAEALAAGLPVAATPSGGVEEILGPDGRYGEIAAGTDAAALAAAVEHVLDRRTSFDPALLRAHVERCAPAEVAGALIDVYRGLIAATGSAVSRDRPPVREHLEEAPPVQEPAPVAAVSPIIAIGLRRSAARARIAALPEDLACGLLVVTSVPGRSDAPEAGEFGPATLHEVDPSGTYREARARLGGPLPPRPRPTRILRAIRHPIRAVRLRRLAARREDMAVHAIRRAIRDALAAVARDGVPTLVLPLEADDMDVCLPLLDGRVRLHGSTLRGMADRWDATGRPVLAPPTPVATAVGRVAYDPGQYWSQLHRRADLSAVGQSGLPPEINGWLYRALHRSVRSFLRRHGLDRPAPDAVFDVGVGTGYWVRAWRALGVRRVDGCDLVQGAVDAVQAETRAAGAVGEFGVADLGVEGSLPDARYPMVSCFNVLLHVVDDAAFRPGVDRVGRPRGAGRGPAPGGADPRRSGLRAAV